MLTNIIEERKSAHLPLIFIKREGLIEAEIIKDMGHKIQKKILM